MDRPELFDHQKYAVAWMVNRERATCSGGHLGDEMGLGKTATVIALIKQYSVPEPRDYSHTDDFVPGPGVDFAQAAWVSDGGPFQDVTNRVPDLAVMPAEVSMWDDPPKVPPIVVRGLRKRFRFHVEGTAIRLPDEFPPDFPIPGRYLNPNQPTFIEQTDKGEKRIYSAEEVRPGGVAVAEGPNQKYGGWNRDKAWEHPDVLAGRGNALSRLAEVRRPRALIVAPNEAVRQNWKREFDRWWPGAPVVMFETDTPINDGDIVLVTNFMLLTPVIHDEAEERQADKTCKQPREPAPGTTARDQLRIHIWHRIIFDEAHLLRNTGTRIQSDSVCPHGFWKADPAARALDPDGAEGSFFKGALDLYGRYKWVVTATPTQTRANDPVALLALTRHPSVRDNLQYFYMRIGQSSRDVTTNAISQLDNMTKGARQAETADAKALVDLRRYRNTDINHLGEQADPGDVPGMATWNADDAVLGGQNPTNAQPTPLQWSLIRTRITQLPPVGTGVRPPRPLIDPDLLPEVDVVIRTVQMGRELPKPGRDGWVATHEDMFAMTDATALQDDALRNPRLKAAWLDDPKYQLSPQKTYQGYRRWQYLLRQTVHPYIGVAMVVKKTRKAPDVGEEGNADYELETKEQQDRFADVLKQIWTMVEQAQIDAREQYTPNQLPERLWSTKIAEAMRQIDEWGIVPQGVAARGMPRAIIMSDIPYALELIGGALRHRGFREFGSGNEQVADFGIIHGKTPVDKREGLLAHFAKTQLPDESDLIGGPHLLLMTYRTGGVGLSLPGASNLLALDEFFTPVRTQQGMARIVRLSRTRPRPITIVRMMATHPATPTMDVRVLSRQIARWRLEQTLQNPGGIVEGDLVRGKQGRTEAELVLQDQQFQKAMDIENLSSELDRLNRELEAGPDAHLEEQRAEVVQRLFEIGIRTEAKPGARIPPKAARSQAAINAIVNEANRITQDVANIPRNFPRDDDKEALREMIAGYLRNRTTRAPPDDFQPETPIYEMRDGQVFLSQNGFVLRNEDGDVALRTWFEWPQDRPFDDSQASASFLALPMHRGPDRRWKVLVQISQGGPRSAFTVRDEPTFIVDPETGERAVIPAGGDVVTDEFAEILEEGDVGGGAVFVARQGVLYLLSQGEQGAKWTKVRQWEFDDEACMGKGSPGVAQEVKEFGFRAVLTTAEENEFGHYPIQATVYQDRLDGWPRILQDVPLRSGGNCGVAPAGMGYIVIDRRLRDEPASKR